MHVRRRQLGSVVDVQGEVPVGVMLVRDSRVCGMVQRRFTVAGLRLFSRDPWTARDCVDTWEHGAGAVFIRERVAYLRRLPCRLCIASGCLLLMIDVLRGLAVVPCGFLDWCDTAGQGDAGSWL